MMERTTVRKFVSSVTLMVAAPLPALAQAQPVMPAGAVARLLDFSWNQTLALSVGIGLASALAAGLVWVVWYRLRLEGDLLSGRMPMSTRIVATGLSLVVAAVLFTWLAHTGTGWCVVVSILGIVLVIVGRAVGLAVALAALTLTLVVARLFNWL